MAGEISSTTRSASAWPTRSLRAISAWTRRTVAIRSARSARSSCDRLEVGGLVGPLVGELGEHLLLDLLDEDPEAEFALLVRVGVGRFELEDVTGLGTHELLVELGHDVGAPDRVRVVVGRQSVLFLAIDGALDVDGHVVTVGGSTLDDLERRVELSHAVDLGVELLVGGLGTLEGHLELLVAVDGHDRTHLDHGVEAHRTLLVASGDVDLGRRDHVDRVLAHRVDVELRQALAHGLFAGDAGSQLRLEQTSRCLPGPEPGNADLLGDPAKRGVEFLVELGFVDRDRQLDLVAVEGFERRVHRFCVGWRRKRHERATVVRPS